MGLAPTTGAASTLDSARLGLAPRTRQLLSDYVELTKPKVQSLLLLTTIATMYLAGDPSPWLVALTCLGGYLSAGGAGAVNHWFDRDIDKMMARTANRPVPSGRVAPRSALLFGCTLAALSLLELSLAVNPLAAALSFSGFLGYVFVYTVWLKRRTPQNIVIGGAAGAVPPLVGWAAVTGSVSGTAVILFFIVFFWTPPHFWALSLLMKDEYAQGRRADAPGRPGRGRDPQADPALLGAALCGHPAALLRGRLRGHLPGFLADPGPRLHRRARYACTGAPDRRSALRLYLYSLAYLALLFCAMVADAHL